MRLEAALVGDLEKVMADELRVGRHAVTLGTRISTDSLKAFLRAETVKAFGSQRLANSWRSNNYPEGGKESLGAAGLVWSNAPDIIEAFSATTTIKGKNGFWLAIPTPEALKLRSSRSRFAPRPTPKSLEEQLGVNLQLVFRAGQASLLVAQLRRGTGKRGGFVKPSARATKTGNVETVVLFFLVPFVRLKQVFNLDQAEDRALDDMVRNILEVWNRER